MQGLAVFLLLSAVLFASEGVVGCSIFSLAKNGQYRYCSNEDEMNFPTFLFAEPAGTGASGEHTFAWLGFGFDASTLGGQGGINSEGLVVDANALTGQGVNTSDGTKQPPPYEFSLLSWLPFFLRHCATVDDVLDLWKNYSWVIPAPLFSAQFHFMDKTGQSVVVGPDGLGGLFFVSSNSSNANETALISTNYNLFNPQLDAPLGYPCWRFETLEKMMSPKIFDSLTGQVTTRAMMQMLEAVSVIGYKVPGSELWVKTVYSLVYDINSMKVTLAVNANACAACTLDVFAVMNLLFSDGSGGVRQIPLEEACSLFDASSSPYDASSSSSASSNSPLRFW